MLQTDTSHKAQLSLTGSHAMGPDVVDVAMVVVVVVDVAVALDVVVDEETVEVVVTFVLAGSQRRL